MTKNLARGRPVDLVRQRAQKLRLIVAAQALLAQKSYRSITIREMADRAGVNSAMIAYYFGSKAGLFTALLQQMSEQHFGMVSKVAEAANPIKAFIKLMLGFFSENKGMASAIQDEFLAENSPLGDAFINYFPRQMAVFLPRLIQSNTHIKDSLQAKYAAFNLMAMIVTPFMSTSIRLQAWEISDIELKSAAWAEQVYALFMHGCNEDLK